MVANSYAFGTQFESVRTRFLAAIHRPVAGAPSERALNPYPPLRDKALAIEDSPKPRSQLSNAWRELRQPQRATAPGDSTHESTGRRSLTALLSAVIVAMTSYAPTRLHAQLDCLPTERVDCSTNWLKVAPPVAAYSEIFADACVLHDYCYRFGAATYGYSRSKCDTKLRRDMRDICGDATIWDFLTLGGTMAACYAAAEAFYEAVDKFGESAFTDKVHGKVCHYEVAFGDKPHVPLSLLSVQKYWILFF